MNKRRAAISSVCMEHRLCEWEQRETREEDLLTMWLCLVALVGLYHLLRWYRGEAGKLLARQLDLRGLRVLAACLTEKGAQKLKGQTSDRVETVILDVTNTQSIAAATQWVKKRVRDRGQYR
ncbi:17-beta-hydroxysteroid dehydrogenase type 6 [Camelus dromedarius]|uniref:17-beta-hydroxysteroid dehydrogenase type 6 n=1 Tax=Camelus dromedarius TaxID=9838 RepID=A0A5N4DH71_CAMDR|nr:17-beta-hydroxysteroid dehydrogenase type 6 [Camelus dromedarius]